MLYIITPTYTRLGSQSNDLCLICFSRAEQEAELTRLGQTLLHVTQLTWIVVEDDRAVTERLKHILQKFPSLNIVLLAGIEQRYI